MRSKVAIALVVSVSLVALPSGVRAAPADSASTSARPWAEAIPQARQDRALRLFEEANKLFEDSHHAAALTKYREALKVWDHPAIRYNAAVALIYLDQPLAAYENLEAALHYGSAPFGPETYEQALTYRKLLLGQLAQLKVECAEHHAEITLDGQPLFVGPGEAARWLMPGNHQLVARKDGFLTETRSLSLLPGRPSYERLTLQDVRSLPIKTVRRWPAWKPWTAVGAGVLLALIGLPLRLDAESNRNAYDAEVARTCSTGTGCTAGSITPTAVDALNRGRTENVVAISLFSIGGALAASGVVLLILNQPHVVQQEGLAPQAQLSPLLGPGTFGLSVAFIR